MDEETRKAKEYFGQHAVSLATFAEETGLVEDDPITTKAYLAWVGSKERFADWWADHQADYV